MTDIQTAPPAPSFPSLQSFCVDLPLYAFYKVTEENFNDFLIFTQRDAVIDSFCPYCSKDSTFKRQDNGYNQGRTTLDSWWEYFPFIEFRFKCSRDNNHAISYSFQFDENQGVQKIGQYPSTYDVAAPSVKRYRKILGEDRCRELVKAIGLFTHGVGAGSLIYLRRLLEYLLEKAHLEAQQSETWKKTNSVDFSRASVGEKIKALSDYLPEYLVNNKKIYSVLSLGIHSGSEEECMKQFPILRTAIELILDQKIEDAKRKRKEKEITTLLHQFG
ncbi:hypothetical protein ACE1YR_12085 [Pseudomonas sp. K1(2024)]|uniref:Short-chain dehydrogenase n=1 Tax=Pseudomonas boreofloridensis TaxID=3064348 RepID=A0ABV4Z948_9PSED|nr:MULTISPECIES: hypothetical protein [unclassified Pseudomonas]MBZ9782781.1 hypothetical protein [Pseudomonas sp. REP124]MDO7901688.1 hypothetical protein [Pseudomonas sp. K13]